jgi:hypothetical protein
MLWTIAAGPLVNVVLIPITVGLWFVTRRAGFAYAHPDLFHFIQTVAVLNAWLLVFNILPIYPLDGGQILRSLLWFVVGRADSLLIASIIGMVGIAGMAVFFFAASAGPLAMFAAVFLGLQCLGGFRQARILAAQERMPRHPQVRCPACGTHPPMAPVWRCELCMYPSDLIAYGGRCPHCGQVQRAIACPDCQTVSPPAAWGIVAPLLAPLPAYFNSPESIGRAAMSPYNRGNV